MGSGEWRLGKGWFEGWNVQVDEFAFVVFHVCCGLGRFGEGGFVVACAVVDSIVEGKIWCVISLSVLATSALRGIRCLD